MTTQWTEAAPSAGKAAAAFLARKAEIDRLLDQLRALSDDHFGVAPDDLHWGHVGALDEVARALRGAVDWAKR
jgi:hypothetical protein